MEGQGEAGGGAGDGALGGVGEQELVGKGDGGDRVGGAGVRSRGEK